MPSPNGPLRVGIGGPVGSGKTALMDSLCKSMREIYDIAAITNDIYTKWDAEFLVRSGSLAAERIVGVETGGTLGFAACGSLGLGLGRYAVSVGLAGLQDRPRPGRPPGFFPRATRRRPRLGVRTPRRR